MLTATHTPTATWIAITPWLANKHLIRPMLSLSLRSLFSCKAVSEALELLCRPVGVLGGPFSPLSPGLKSYVAHVTADSKFVAQ